MQNPQLGIRVPQAVHDRLTRLGEALDARAPEGARPLGKTGAAALVLLSGLAAAEKDLGLAPAPARKVPSKAKPPAKRASKAKRATTKRVPRRSTK